MYVMSIDYLLRCILENTYSWKFMVVSLMEVSPWKHRATFWLWKWTSSRIIHLNLTEKAIFKELHNVFSLFSLQFPTGKLSKPQNNPYPWEFLFKKITRNAYCQKSDLKHNIYNISKSSWTQKITLVSVVQPNVIHFRE